MASMRLFGVLIWLIIWQPGYDAYYLCQCSVSEEATIICCYIFRLCCSRLGDNHNWKLFPPPRPCKREADHSIFRNDRNWKLFPPPQPYKREAGHSMYYKALDDSSDHNDNYVEISVSAAPHAGQEASISHVANNSPLKLGQYHTKSKQLRNEPSNIAHSRTHSYQKQHHKKKLLSRFEHKESLMAKALDDLATVSEGSPLIKKFLTRNNPQFRPTKQHTILPVITHDTAMPVFRGLQEKVEIRTKDSQIITKEEPHITLEESTKETLESSFTSKEPFRVKGKPQKASEVPLRKKKKSPRTTEKTFIATKRFPKSTEKPPRTTAKLLRNTEKPPKTIEKSFGTAKKSPRTKAKPHRTTKKPQKSTEKPYLTSLELPTTTEEPFQITEDLPTTTEIPFTITKTRRITEKSPKNTGKPHITSVELPTTTEEPFEITGDLLTTIEEPLTITDNAARIKDKPFRITEKPPRTTNEPLITEESPEIAEDPPTTTEEPPTTTEEPPTTTEELPTTEEPSTATEEPSTATEESSTTTEEAPTISDKVPKTTKKAHRTTELPLRTTDKSPRTTKKLPRATKDPLKIIEKPLLVKEIATTETSIAIEDDDKEIDEQKTKTRKSKVVALVTELSHTADSLPLDVEANNDVEDDNEVENVKNLAMKESMSEETEEPPSITEISEVDDDDNKEPQSKPTDTDTEAVDDLDEEKLVVSTTEQDIDESSDEQFVQATPAHPKLSSKKVENLGLDDELLKSITVISQSPLRLAMATMPPLRLGKMEITPVPTKGVLHIRYLDRNSSCVYSRSKPKPLPKHSLYPMAVPWRTVINKHDTTSSAFVSSHGAHKRPFIDSEKILPFKNSRRYSKSEESTASSPKVDEGNLYKTTLKLSKNQTKAGLDSRYKIVIKLPL